MSNGNVGRWGKMRPETMRLLLDAFCDTQDGRKDYVAWLTGLIRTGDNLANREKKDLMRWLIEHGYSTGNLEEVFTVQYAHDECAAALGCDKRQARRYRDWLESLGVLTMVQSGKRGYSALFVLAPVRVTNSVDIVPEIKGTIQTEKGDNSPEIGGQSKSRDLQKRVRIQSNPELSKDKAENWKCSRCGAHQFEVLNERQVLCLSCMTVHPMPP